MSALKKTASIFICLSCLNLGITVKAQQNLFSLYTDSAALVNDANQFIGQFAKAVKKIRPDLAVKPKAILNTQLSLIFYNDKNNTVNFPLWEQVVLPQQNFFFKLGGSEAEGKKVFGLLFNGFYLPHELGHAVQYAASQNFNNEYDKEYFANTIAVLYWRHVGKIKELETSYRYAKKFLSQLKNPVPVGEDEKEYLTKNYKELSNDPFKYGYFEFSQFVKIYEDKLLPSFSVFVKNLKPRK